jgi:hypothetical protein
MYNTEYKCIYNKDDLFIDSDNLSEENKSLIRDELYRNDILHIFQLEEYNEEFLSKKFDDLYYKISNCDQIMNCISSLMNEYYGFNEDKKFGIIFLFTYDNLYLFHPCISDYLLDGVIKEENWNNVKKKLIL